MVGRLSVELEVTQKASSVLSGPLRRSEGWSPRLTAEYPVKRVCQVLDYPCSSYGGPSKGREEQLRREAIAGVAAAWPPDGYRRLTAQLRPEGWRVKIN